jgi:hypothetical protein
MRFDGGNEGEYHKDLKRGGNGLFKGTISAREASVTAPGTPAEIRTRYLPNIVYSGVAAQIPSLFA